MQIVTLTTDFGNQDYYVGAFKGILLKQNPTLNLVDVSHNVQPYDIVQGAFIFKNVWKNYPKGSIHIIAINNRSEQTDLLAIEQNGHFFLGPDNGIFSLIFEELPIEIYRMPVIEEEIWDGAKFARIIHHLMEQKPLSDIAAATKSIEQRITLHPVISTSQIKGSIVHIDHYDNAIINIHELLFEQICNERSFTLYFKRNDPITKLSQHYFDVPIGETLCRFNAAGYLEIAINMGKASSLLGLKLDDTVQIDFFN